MSKTNNHFIPFHIPFVSGDESAELAACINSSGLSGQFYGEQAEAKIKMLTRASNALLTSSGTHALEIAAQICGIEPGDEVIMPSFNFVSSANAFVLAGAKLIFVDVDEDTMNVCPKAVEAAITKKTKAIVIVHYGGVACDLKSLKEIATDNELLLIEDAAHGIGAYWEDCHLGTVGDLGILSFHYTKNIQCGEGGALLINNPQFLGDAIVYREKGTNRGDYLSGKIDKYTWVAKGSSYTLSELNAAFLCRQLEWVEKVAEERGQIAAFYQNAIQKRDGFEIQKAPEYSKTNHHVFFLKCRSGVERRALSMRLKGVGVETAFHYVPLHSSPAGRRYGEFRGVDRFTTSGSACLLRLPVYPDLVGKERVAEEINRFTNES